MMVHAGSGASTGERAGGSENLRCLLRCCRSMRPVRMMVLDVLHSLKALTTVTNTRFVDSTRSVHKSVVTTFDPGRAFTSIVGPIPVVSNANAFMKRSAAVA